MLDGGYTSARRFVYSYKYHVIGCPKYLRSVLTGPVESRLKVIVREVAAEVLEMEVMPDHAHHPFDGPHTEASGQHQQQGLGRRDLVFPAQGGDIGGHAEPRINGNPGDPHPEPGSPKASRWILLSSRATK